MSSNKPSRRTFLQSAAATVALAPAILTAKRTAAQDVIGQGDYQFRFQHHWPQLPSQYRWQTTHNVDVDPDNHLYVIHEGNATLADHPSIFVFDPEGRFVRAFGEQFQGGGHGIKIRVEEGTPYLYVAGYQQVKSIAKMSLTGEIVWQQYAPVECGKYATGEASDPRQAWGRNRFLPTNFTFLDDGGFLLADGYGAYLIHRYDAQGNWVSAFGGEGPGEGTFNTPHGLAIDDRSETPVLVVTDRAHHSLQVLGIDGSYQRTIPDFGLPANVDTHGDLMVVPELVARVSLVDRDYKTLVTLGDDRERILADKSQSNGFTIRADESRWQDGKFVHPHDACFDNDGNLFVAEWVATGRVTKLTRV